MSTTTSFEKLKNDVLGKRDKSSAGRIDPYAVDICAVLNQLSYCYTSSSCAGRCFLYRGPGRKSTTKFERFRVSHDKITDPVRYFDLSTLYADPTGGGDTVRSVGQLEHAERVRLQHQIEPRKVREIVETYHSTDTLEQQCSSSLTTTTTTEGESVWLRFEPFILHVACRSLAAACAVMTAARPAFKNVGLTTWNDSRYLVAIWGDEGLDLPLCSADGVPLMVDSTTTNGVANTSARENSSLAAWYAQLVNDRHERNWNKIHRFVQSVREMPAVLEEDETSTTTGLIPPDDGDDAETNQANIAIPRSFDVIGDVALLHSLSTSDPAQQHDIGQAILRKNKAIQVVALRHSNLNGVERAPGQQGVSVIAGVDRNPLLTTHTEHGIKCVVDVRHVFFSPRMGAERLRLCQQVARGEHVLVLFAGVAMEALQIAGRTEASSITAIELNSVAVECARRAHRMLERNKSVKCLDAAERLEIRQGDVLEMLPTLPRNHYDRVLAPRPKEGALDGDLGNGDGGIQFLRALLPVMKQRGGECHWYDFVADHEYPECSRTRRLIESVCQEQNLTVEILHAARVGCVAMRQIRVCLDFRIFVDATSNLLETDSLID